MSIRFIDSQTIEIDGSQLVYLRDVRGVLRKIEETLKEVGPERFYSSPDNEIKKIRESMAELFFLCATKSASGRDSFLLQPNEEFPDFYVMSITEGDPPISLHGFELTEVPPRIESFEDAMAIVNAKLARGYQPKCNLLIFLNNVNGKQWTRKFTEELKTSPFIETWTIQILTDNANTRLRYAVAHRLLPRPLLEWVADFNDHNLFRPTELPKFTEVLETGTGNFFQFKRDFIGTLLKKMRRYLLAVRKQ